MAYGGMPPLREFDQAPPAPAHATGHGGCLTRTRRQPYAATNRYPDSESGGTSRAPSGFVLDFRLPTWRLI